MIWSSVVLVCLSVIAQCNSLPPMPTPTPTPTPKDESIWFNIESELLDFLLLFGSDLVNSPVEIQDVSFADGSLAGVSVVKMYDARPSGSPILKAHGFNEFSVDANIDVNMRINVDNFTTGELSEPAAVTVFDVHLKVKLAVMNVFKRSCATRLRATALSYGQILLVLPGKKLVLDEKVHSPYMRAVLGEAVLDYLNENFFNQIHRVLNFDSYICR